MIARTHSDQIPTSSVDCRPGGTIDSFTLRTSKAAVDDTRPSRETDLLDNPIDASNNVRVRSNSIVPQNLDTDQRGTL